MKIYFWDDKPIELAIDHDTAWSWWSAVKHGIAEIKICVPFRGGRILYDFARIDADRTFRRRAAEPMPAGRHDAIPPPPDTIKSPPSGVATDDPDG